jgi:hypothetical protein
MLEGAMNKRSGVEGKRMRGKNEMEGYGMLSAGKNFKEVPLVVVNTANHQKSNCPPKTLSVKSLIPST